MGISGKRHPPVALTSGNGHRYPLNKWLVGTQRFIKEENHSLLNMLSELTLAE